MKNLFSKEEFQLNEILFQNRNRSYGAYVLRSEYDRVLTKSMFIGVAVFAAIALTPLAINAFSTPVETVPPVHRPFDITPVDEIPEKQPETVKPIVKDKPVATVKLDLPTPKRNVTKETPATPLSEADDKKIGTENIEGEKPVEKYVPPVVHGNVEVPKIKDVAPEIVDDSPKTVVDVKADFKGGINAFRNKVAQNFDVEIFNGSGDKLSTVVTFIVEKDGTISNVKAAGNDAAFNKEAEATVKSIKGKWTPAKVKGQFVRSYFKFPVTMQFE